MLASFSGEIPPNAVEAAPEEPFGQVHTTGSGSVRPMTRSPAPTGPEDAPSVHEPGFSTCPGAALAFDEPPQIDLQASRLLRRSQPPRGLHPALTCRS